MLEKQRNFENGEETEAFVRELTSKASVGCSESMEKTLKYRDETNENP